ncbi:unnamed protein product [Diplocarpon coronariae]
MKPKGIPKRKAVLESKMAAGPRFTNMLQRQHGIQMTPQGNHNAAPGAQDACLPSRFLAEESDFHRCAVLAVLFPASRSTTRPWVRPCS